MKRKLVFRADAGKSIGFGHFIRSLALAAYLKDDFDCYFTTFNPDSKHPSGYQMAEIGKVCRYLALSGKDIEDFDNNFLKMLDGSEIVVLDNYYFSTEYQQKIKDKGCRLVCIDDMHDRKMLCDLLITGSPLSVEAFEIMDGSKFLGGLEYSFLREPFLHVSSCKRQAFGLKKIVLAVGGADPHNLTNSIIGIILSIDPEINLSVIAGDTVKIDDNLSGRIKLYRRLSAEEIVDIFCKSDLGIFPASTICIEALASGLPVAAFWYVDNQEEFYRYGVDNYIFFPLGNPIENMDEFSNNVQEALQSKCLVPPQIDFKKGKREIIEAFKTL